MRCLPLLFLLFFLQTPAYAYIDPGTGSFLVQWLIALFVSGFFVLKLYWQRFKNFFRKEGAKKSAKKDGLHEKD